MAIDRFTPRVLVDSINKILPVSQMLLDMFFRRTVNSPEEVIDYEIKSQGRGLMRHVKRGEPAVVVSREGREIKTVRLPSLREKVTIKASVVAGSQPSGVPIGGQTPDERLSEQIATEQKRFVDRAARRKEFMAAGALQGGYTVSQDNVSVTIDFGFRSTHKPSLTGQAKWDASATSDPKKDLRRFGKLVSKDSGFTPNVVILGEDAADVFLSNEAVLKALDNRNLQAGLLVEKPGASYLGTFVGFEMYMNNESYVDDAGATQLMIPANACIVASTAAPFTLYHGAINDLDAGLVAMPFFSKMWKEQDPSGLWLLCESNPLCVPCDPDAVVCATVL